MLTLERNFLQNIQRNVPIGRIVCNHCYREIKASAMKRVVGVLVTADSRHMTVFYLDEAHPRGRSPSR